MAEAKGWSSAEAGGRELAEAAGVSEAGLMAEAEEVSIVTLLVSVSSTADCKIRLQTFFASTTSSVT